MMQRFGGTAGVRLICKTMKKGAQSSPTPPRRAMQVGRLHTVVLHSCDAIALSNIWSGRTLTCRNKGIRTRNTYLVAEIESRLVFVPLLGGGGFSGFFFDRLAFQSKADFGLCCIRENHFVCDFFFFCGFSFETIACCMSSSRGEVAGIS